MIADAVSRPALRYHGGKFRLAAWIQQFFPPHRCYVESFGGAGSVLLTKPRSRVEVYNDLDIEVVNFFRVLRDEHLSQRLIEQLRLTPFARVEFEGAIEIHLDPVERARRMAVRAWMGYGSSGGTKAKTGFRTDTHQNKRSTEASQWVGYPDHLPNIVARLQGVLIENRPASAVMIQHDTPSTLHYVDPPYMLSTRQMGGGGNCYRHEMTDWQHMDLLTCLRNLDGAVVLSGYHTPDYADRLTDWVEYSTTSAAGARKGTKIMREVVWLNPACVDGLARMRS